MDLENMSMDQFNALSADQQRALLENGALEAQQPEETTPEVSETVEEVPQGVPAPQPSAEEQAIQAEQQRRGNPEVPLRQLREENRQKDEMLRQQAEQLQQMQAMMAQLMGQGMQQQQPQAPELAVEDPEALSYYIANHPEVQQLKQTNQQLQQFLAQAQQERQMAELKEHFGEEGPSLVAQFDQAAPHLADVDPQFKVLAMLGFRSRDPQYQQQQQAQTQQTAEELAAKKLEQVLANPGKRLPQTLANVPPAQGNEMSVDINNLSMADFDKMSDEDRRKLRSQF